MKKYEFSINKRENSLTKNGTDRKLDMNPKISIKNNSYTTINNENEEFENNSFEFQKSKKYLHINKVIDSLDNDKKEKSLQNNQNLINVSEFHKSYSKPENLINISEFQKNYSKPEKDNNDFEAYVKSNFAEIFEKINELNKMATHLVKENEKICVYSLEKVNFYKKIQISIYINLILKKFEEKIKNIEEKHRLFEMKIEKKLEIIEKNHKEKIKKNGIFSE